MLVACRQSLLFRDNSLNDALAFGSGLYPGMHIKLNTYYGSTISDTDVCISEYSGLYERLLLPSSDVETNPGPLSESEKTLLNAIRSSEKHVVEQISEVKADITAMKTEIAAVKSECLQTKTDIEVVKLNQAKTDKLVKSLQKEIRNMQDEKETMQLDIDQLHEDFETKLDLMADMDDELNRLDRENRKATVRIFGLAEKNR